MPGEVDFDELRRLAVEHQRCGKCGDRVRQEATGEVPRVAVQFTLEEAAAIAIESSDPAVRARMLCALSLLDPDLADELRIAMTDTACANCGEAKFVAATDNDGALYVGCANCRIADVATEQRS